MEVNTTLKPVLSARATRILDKALAAMKRWPETVEMGDWLSHEHRATRSRKRPAPYCGTTACLAGHIALAATRRLPPNLESYNEPKYDKDQLPRWLVKALGWSELTCENIALAVLGFPVPTPTIFFLEKWPLAFRKRYWSAQTPRQRSAAVIARVRHWLRTGE